MDIVKEVTELKEKQATFVKANKEYEDCKDKLLNYVMEATKMYYKEQVKIYEVINKIRYVYEDRIPYNKIDSFTVEEEYPNYYDVCCDYTDRDGEFFSWDIKLPKDKSELGKFVKEFRNEILQELKDKKKQKEDKDKEIRRQSYMELKEEFEKEK